ncbi:hypothetical protein [Frigoribacterium sp. Leaf186]|jgi:hypothetical protein|uniref:hypothetical protein n=1 Tax=Frigoribacterium sp. Leaf186 TaxID=1736293 RepID=UPI0006FB0042|nr:hypothetical protein [Frigoribacterium sp. Leaf186]KQS17544.1 hypothetical protein ASG05_08780 [Frigoribacterium sp. Leaf186]
MKLLAGLLTAVLVVTVLLVLAVRADPDVPLSLSGADARIPYCTTYEPVIVADLTTDTLPTCAPHGVEMRFPDGYVIDLPDEPGTGGRSDGGHDYTYVDVGAFGMYAARADHACEQIEQWGTPEAIRRVTEAFGDDYVCVPDRP